MGFKQHLGVRVVIGVRILRYYKNLEVNYLPSNLTEIYDERCPKSVTLAATSKEQTFIASKSDLGVSLHHFDITIKIFLRAK